MILTVVSLVDGGAFAQLVVAGGAGMVVYVIIVVPIKRIHQLKPRLARSR